MTAFERETDLRIAGMQALGEHFEGNVFEEVARGGHTIDALVARPDPDAQAKREELGIDEPPTGDRRAIYEWVAREDGRPLGDLLDVSPADEQLEDEALVDELIDDGWIDVTDGGLLTAVEVPRPVETIAVAFALDDVKQARVSVGRTRPFTDQQYVVTTEACREDAQASAALFQSAGVGVAVLDDDGTLDVVVEAETGPIEDGSVARGLAEDAAAGWL
ncbi:hypothetical protein [Halorubrum sp. CSM-61]|uniref:hypothetical protein n=1 Tax=Halorubrum sp. CSM-61 TaxID=2485838 RepID=UPI000F4CE7D4|nr:hypothetical protein [Halorubrum sp. CSM-61]